MNAPGNFLEKILERRREQVASDRAAEDFATMLERAITVRANTTRIGLRDTLAECDDISIIGEFKRASPSLGPINPAAKPAETAKLYERAGVRAISVLTEPEFFQGSLDDLREVRSVTELPILRKDFIVDPFQIAEAAAAGADVVLLIAAALSDGELLKFREFAESEIGLDALVEVHSAEEMERAVGGGAKLIGVNNRDLRTFKTSLETSVELARLAPNDAILVSESGISSRDDIERLRDCGYRGFLIGESLLRAPDPAALMRELRHV
ncbi:MAG: indole-3-glycerol phosphate synthase TrpC [Chthoniobacterales bacterium]